MGFLAGTPLDRFVFEAEERRFFVTGREFPPFFSSGIIFASDSSDVLCKLGLPDFIFRCKQLFADEVSEVSDCFEVDGCGDCSLLFPSLPLVDVLLDGPGKMDCSGLAPRLVGFTQFS